ncbi:MAG TPA: secretin N-terminal domain-containing protein, partial [Opitutaceae bacterium]|nr:secretin N-terminal domain-containing protein [Opitutaceae bacterium]
MRTKKLALALAVAFSVGAYNASAQDAAATTSTTPTAAGSETVTIKDDAGSGGTAVKTGKDSAGRDTLSVDFPDEEIRNILRNVADLFELNLVIPETLQGKTSIKLRDVTWRQIFQVVLQPVNYSYIEDGSIIRVVDNASLQQEPTSTEVFILNYAKAADVQPVVASMVEANAGGKLVVDTRSNALVITERPSRFNRIRPIIENLDRATDQVMIESKFIEV